ncbi:hypothetical protein Y032_0008g144 [Ancylostoma ceylanicum]|nr:hypothetical protein Y032_0008g144 [Ancylostoma ceylanicum]
MYLASPLSKLDTVTTRNGKTIKETMEEAPVSLPKNARRAAVSPIVYGRLEFTVLRTRKPQASCCTMNGPPCHTDRRTLFLGLFTFLWRKDRNEQIGNIPTVRADGGNGVYEAMYACAQDDQCSAVGCMTNAFRATKCCCDSDYCNTSSAISLMTTAIFIAFVKLFTS